MQTGIQIQGKNISGTLNEISDYTDFSSNPDEQSGHYLALKVSDTPKADKITVELVGGTKGPVALDADRQIVLLIANKYTQTVKVVATKGSKTTTETYTLTGLILA